MKEEELDRLFRQKSEMYRAEPSPLAWQQLEEGLQHKKKKKVWVFLSGAAAGALLLFGLWAHLEYSSTFIAPDAHISRKATPPEAPAQRDQELIETGDKALAETEEREQKINPVEEEIKSFPQSPAAKAKSIQAVASVQQKKKESGSTLTGSTDSPKLPLAENKPVQVPEPAEVVVEMPELIAAAPENQAENIIISYSAADEINRNLPAAPDDPLASEQEERDFSPRAVAGFFKKVKENSSASLADIREAKNELLSFRSGR